MIDVVALVEVKVFPKVDPYSLEPVDKEVNVGPRDEVLLLSLDFHVARILFFMSIKSTSVALNPPMNQDVGLHDIHCRLPPTTHKLSGPGP